MELLAIKVMIPGLAPQFPVRRRISVLCLVPGFSRCPPNPAELRFSLLWEAGPAADGCRHPFGTCNGRSDPQPPAALAGAIMLIDLVQGHPRQSVEPRRERYGVPALRSDPRHRHRGLLPSPARGRDAAALQPLRWPSLIQRRPSAARRKGAASRVIRCCKRTMTRPRLPPPAWARHLARTAV